MAYVVVYHPAVLSDDLPHINRNLQQCICRAIERRITSEPTFYGEPLRHQYKGYWKLRVGDYRVIYQLVGQEVWVYRIGHRRDVYAGLHSRFLWRP